MGRSQAERFRADMVERQLRGRGIRDEAVLAAMAAVPRERFVPPQLSSLAYSDDALPIAAGQSISQPWIVARITELLEPRPGMRVLEVGTGSGYQAAVLARIGCLVLSVERHAELADAARARLDELGLGGAGGAGLGLGQGAGPGPGGGPGQGPGGAVRIVVGDGSVGRPEDAPFDGIVVTAAAPRIPSPLIAQLADGGRLVVPVGPRGRQELMLVVRRGDSIERHECGPCTFVPLIGAEGFSEAAARRRRRWPWRLL